jgi:mannose-1-phosphate guanylyltransferase/phosphomannomutase
MSAMKPLYTSELLAFGCDLTGCAIQVRCDHRPARKLLEEVLTRLGCDTERGEIAELSTDGTALQLLCADGSRIPHARLLALGALAEFEAGNDAALRYDAPRIIDELAEKAGPAPAALLPLSGRYRRPRGTRAGGRQRWSIDGLALCVRLLRFAKQRGVTVGQAAALLPPFSVIERGVRTSGSPARLISAMGSGLAAEGVWWCAAKRALRCCGPSNRGAAFGCFAESVSAELAAEFCDDLIARLNGQESDLLDSGAASVIIWYYSDPCPFLQPGRRNQQPGARMLPGRKNWNYDVFFLNCLAYSAMIIE